MRLNSIFSLSLLVLAPFMNGCNGGRGSTPASETSPAPSFSLVLDSGTLTSALPPSGTSAVNTTVHVVPVGGFTGIVAFTLEGAPSGVTATFSPASSTTTSSVQLTIAATATPGITTLTVRGTSPGIAGASRTLNLTLTDSSSEDQLPILLTVEEECRKLGGQGTTPLEQARAIAAFMKGRSEYLDAGVDEASLSAWGELQNGRLHVVTTAYAPAKTPSDPAPLPLDRYQVETRPAGTRMVPTQASAAQKTFAAAGTNNTLPAASYARLMHSFGANFEGQDPINDVGSWLKSTGWTVHQLAEGAASIEMLRAVQGDGFFYINCHGGHANKSSTGTRFYCLSSSTVQTNALDKIYKDEWDNYRIVYLTGRNGDTILGGLVDDWDTYYGITYAFVEKYWNFAANSVVWINACYSQNGAPSTNAFRFACLQKGAGVYLGWTDSLSSGAAFPAIRYFADRCLGANKFRAEYPAQRPFPWDLVIADMSTKNLTRGSNGEVLVATPRTASTSPCLLAPSIRLIEVDEFSFDMKLKGAFGEDEGEVTVGGTPVTVNSWSSEEILCTLPKPLSGDVQVKVRSLKSNPRPLTEWSIPLAYTWDMAGNVIKFQGTANLRYRMDVSGFRNKPGETPTYLRRGTWPVMGGGIPVTGSATTCTLTGGTINLPSLPSDQNPSAFITAPLIVDANSKTGLLGLAFGANPSPWLFVCPGGIPAPIGPSFGQLQQHPNFYQTQAEDASAEVGPITAVVVSYGSEMQLMPGTYTDGTAGPMTVDWQSTTQKNPPRPADAGI